MTEIRIRTDPQGRIRGISASGHAGKGQWGKDVVCAGISALMQALWVALVDVLQVPGAERHLDGDPVRMDISWLPSDDPRLDAIARTFARSLRGIEASYPRHVRVMEVQES
jgi:uncharacterized protein YsxB (DUF464 family)